MDVKAYASKFLSMRQRVVEEQVRPTSKQINEWFVNRLKTVSHEAVRTKNAKTQEEFDAIVDEAKVA